MKSFARLKCLHLATPTVKKGPFAPISLDDEAKEAFSGAKDVKLYLYEDRYIAAIVHLVN